MRLCWDTSLSKGSKPRPGNHDKWSKGWERIFNKKKTKDITKLKNVWEERSVKKWLSCNNSYPRDYFPTKQKAYKVTRLDICKECYKK